MYGNNLRNLNEAYQQIYENKFYSEIVDYLIDENVVYSIDEGYDLISIFNENFLNELYSEIMENREKARRAELRAYSLENKRSKEVKNLDKSTKDYIKSFRGMVTAQRAKRYYAGRPAPSDVTSLEKERKGYRAPQSRIK